VHPLPPGFSMRVLRFGRRFLIKYLI
jgi:hypothetical protein